MMPDQLLAKTYLIVTRIAFSNQAVSQSNRQINSQIITLILLIPSHTTKILCVFFMMYFLYYVMDIYQDYIDTEI